MTERIYPITLEEAADRLLGAKKILIISHANPDGDCVGSAGALAVIARAVGVDAHWLSPDKIPNRLSVISDSEEPETAVDVDSFDTVCTVDTASAVQLGGLEYLADKVDFMIDHHETGEAYAPYYVDVRAAATGEIIFKLYQILKARGKVKILPEASRRIYGAIVSDTGSFKYSNVSAETHLIAAELHREINSAEDGGETTESLCRNLFGKRTLKDMKAQALAISKLSWTKGGRLGYVVITAEDLLSCGLESSDIGMSVETPRALEGVEVALSIRQLPEKPDTFKVSSRSNTDYNVAEVCASFGGGGHIKAAGCTVIAKSVEEAEKIILKAFGDKL